MVLSLVTGKHIHCAAGKDSTRILSYV